MFDGKGDKVHTKKTVKSIDELAEEVIRGDWSNGGERKKKLTAAGYDYRAIQKSELDIEITSRIWMSFGMPKGCFFIREICLFKQNSGYRFDSRYDIYTITKHAFYLKFLRIMKWKAKTSIHSYYRFLSPYSLKGKK